MTEGQAQPSYHLAKVMAFALQKHFEAIISDIFIFIKSRQTASTAHTISLGSAPVHVRAPPPAVHSYPGVSLFVFSSHNVTSWEKEYINNC